MLTHARIVAWIYGFAVCLVTITTQADEAHDERAIAYFETHVRPLLAKHCYQCHSERAGKSEGDLLLDRRSGWLAGGQNGASVIPGDVEASLLIRDPLP